MKRIRVVHVGLSLAAVIEVQGRPIHVDFGSTGTYGVEIHYEEGRPSEVCFVAAGGEVEETFKYLCTVRSFPFTSTATGANINGHDIWSLKPAPLSTYHAYWRQK